MMTNGAVAADASHEVGEPPRLGMLLVGHGTRDVRGQREFLELARLVADLDRQVAVEPGFLELASPTIACAWSRLHDRGVSDVFAVPLMLFAAGHAKEDIPEALAEVAGRPVPLAAHLGTHARLVALSQARARAALTGSLDLPAARRKLLLVGRGSSDASATAEMQEFCRLSRQYGLFHETEVAFVAKAQPSLSEALERLGRAALENAAASRRADGSAADGSGESLPAKEIPAEEIPAEQILAEQIVVQPHLLFQGRVIDEVHAAVESARHRFPQQQWFLAEHLGPSPELAKVVHERFSQLVAKGGVEA